MLRQTARITFNISGHVVIRLLYYATWRAYTHTIYLYNFKDPELTKHRQNNIPKFKLVFSKNSIYLYIYIFTLVCKGWPCLGLDSIRLHDDGCVSVFD